MGRIKAFIQHLKKAVSNAAYLNESLPYHVGYAIAKQHMEDLALYSQIPGVTEGNVGNSEVIVSLTTHGERIYNVFRAIESIFQQSVKANKVILYLSDKEFKDKELPALLKNQMKRGLEVHYVRDIRAYTKLIPAIKEFPDATIITIDDDYMYPINTIERLIKAHQEHPNAVCCHASRAIIIANEKELKPYSTFPQIFPKKLETDIPYMAEGFGAVLYPPHCMHEDAVKDELFMKLSPLADDLWYKCMELLVDTPVYQLPRNRTWFSTMYSDETVQDLALANQNVNENKNDMQLKAIFDHYNLYSKLRTK
ncbi:MAG: hypothetical protein Q4D30_06260 [Bacteroidales bacterium]|nr:hypothetical protein [Bacteroidales bacterium]